MKEEKPIAQQLDNITIALRQGDYATAASQLNRCATNINHFLGSISMTSGQLKKIAYSLETILILQQQKDWVGVADVIEFELSRLLYET